MPSDKKLWKIQQNDGSIVQFYGPRDMDDDMLEQAANAQSQLDQQKKDQRKFDLADKLFPQTNSGMGKLAAGFSEFMNTPLLPEIQSGEQYFKNAQPAANTLEATGQGIQGFGRDVYNDVVRPFTSPTGIAAAAVPGAGLIKSARPAATLATRALPGLMSAAAAPGAVMDVGEAVEDPRLANVTRAMSSVGNVALGGALTKQMMTPRPTPPPRTIPTPTTRALPPGNPPPPQGMLGIGGAEYQPPQRPFNPDPNAPIAGYPPQPAQQLALPPSPLEASLGSPEPQRLLAAGPGPEPAYMAEANVPLSNLAMPEGLNYFPEAAPPELPAAPPLARSQILERGGVEPLPEMPVVPGVEFAKERRSRVERLNPDVLEQARGEAAKNRTVERPSTQETIPEPRKYQKGENLEGYPDVTYEGEGFGGKLYKYGGKEGNNFSTKMDASQQEFLDAYFKARQGYESRIANEKAKTAQPQPAPEKAPETPAAQPETPPKFEPRTVGEHTIEESGNPKLPYQLRKGETVVAKGLKPDSFDAYLKRDAELQNKLREIDKKYGTEEESTSDIPEGFQEEVTPERTVERPSKKKEVRYPLAEKRPGERGSIRLFSDEGEEPLKSGLRYAFRPERFKKEVQPTSELFKIMNEGGISKEEIGISKLHDFIVKNPKKFNVADLQKHLDENQVTSQETTFQDLSKDELRQLTASKKKLEVLDNEFQQAYDAGIDEQGNFRSPGVNEYLNQLTEKISPLRDQVEALEEKARRNPKFTQYTEPGHRINSREILTNIKGKEIPKFSPKEIEDFDSLSLKKHMMEYGNGPAFTPEEAARFNELKSKADEVERLKDREAVIEFEVSPVHGYGRNSVDVNRLSHAFVDERILEDGGTATHLSELQSDWMQSRKKGFASREDAIKRHDLREERSGIIQSVERYSPENLARRSEIDKELAELSPKVEGKTVEPPAHQKDWIDLGMKRALVEAAKKGSDFLTWSKGDTVAERYGLHHQVDTLTIYRTANGLVVEGFKDGHYVFQREVAPNDIQGQFGQTVADKVKTWLSEDKGSSGITLEGQDLKIGGNWARNQYDQKMVNYMNDLAKKNGWPSRVEVQRTADLPTKGGKQWAILEDGDPRTNFEGDEIRFDTREEATAELENIRNYYRQQEQTPPLLQVWRDEAPSFGDPAGNEVHAIRITPEMRKQLTEKGLPTSGEKFPKSEEKFPKAQERPGERGSLSNKPAEGISDLTKKRQDLMTPITDVIAGLGKSGKEIARLMTRARLVGEHYSGTWENRAKEALSDISDTEFGAVNKDGKVLRGNLIDVLEGNAEPASPKIRAAADSIRQLLDETGERAESSGMSLRVGDRNVPFEKRENYFPHLYTEEFWNRIKQDSQFKEKILQRIIKQNPSMTMDSAAKALQRARQFGERLIDPQHERVFNLPGWERSKGALFKHLHDMGRQIGNAEELGPKDIAGPKLDRLIKQTNDPEYAYELLKRAMKRDEPPAIRDVKIASKITNAASWAYLSRAAIGNLAQLTRIPAHASFSSAAKAFGQYLTDRQGLYSKALNSGAIVEIGAKGLMEEFGSKSRAYKTYGIEQSEKFLRGIASAAGRSEAEATFRALKEDPTNAKLRAHLSDILQEDAGNVIKQEKLSDKQSAVAGGRMAELTQGRAEAMDLPKNWSGSPYANLYFLYKKYALQDTRNMWKAIKKNPGKAIATIAVLNQAAGETVGDVKEALKGLGKGLITGDIKGEVSEKVANRGDYISKDNPTVGRFIDNYLQSWTFGVLSDALQNIRKGEFAGTVGEMASDVVTSVGSAGKRIVEGKEEPLKPLEKAATQMIPVLGPGIREGLFPKEEPKKRKGPPRRVIKMPHRKAS